MKKDHFREEVSTNLQEIVQDKHSKAIKYEKLLGLYKKLNGVLNIFDQWEKELLAKERALKDVKLDPERPTRELETLSRFIGKMENIENISKKTFMDILAQKNEIKEHEKTLRQRESSLLQKEAELNAWSDKTHYQDKKAAVTKLQQQSEAFKGEAEKIEKLRAELESKATNLMKQELMQNQRDKNMKDKELELQDKENQLNHREKTITTREGFLTSREERLELTEKELRDRESELKQKEVLFGEREILFSERESKLGEKEQAVSFREQAVRDKENHLAEKEQKLLEKEIALSDKEAEVVANTKKYEDRFEKLKKSFEEKEQALIKLKEAALEEKLQVQSLAQANLEELKQKEAELLKREKEIAKFTEEASKRRESTVLFEQKVKRGVDPEMLEAYRKEVEKAFIYTKTDIKRVTAEYSNQEPQDREKHKLALDWFKAQLNDKIAQFEQFLTGRMVELQSYLDPDSIPKSGISKEQLMHQILDPKSDERLELEELRRTLGEREKELIKKEEFFKRRETDLLNKAWKIKNMVRKINTNLKENTIKNQQDNEIQNSLDLALEGNKSPDSSEGNPNLLSPPRINTQEGFTESLPK